MFTNWLDYNSNVLYGTGNGSYNYNPTWAILPRSNISDIKQNFKKHKSFYLEQNYPNPFNPATTINYTIPEAGSVKLVVMNTKGETVKVLANGVQNAGNHNFNFDGSGLNSGVYFYQLIIAEKAITKKMILIK